MSDLELGFSTELGDRILNDPVNIRDALVLPGYKIFCLSGLLGSVLAGGHSLASPPDDADLLKRDRIARREHLL